MSTAPKPRRTPRRPAADPFRYGWRDVPVKRPGGWDVERTPLSREDVLHPQEGDFVVENNAHSDDLAYLKGVFQSRLAGDPTALVLSDTGVYWNVPRLRHHSPDSAVILGVRDPGRDFPSFQVAQEGVRPVLIVEVTSPGTRGLDLRTKRSQYYRAGVPFYAIADELPRRRPRQLRILGYRRGPHGFERLPVSADGRLWLDPVGLWLGAEGGRVACYDEAARRIGDYTEVSEAREAAEERALSAEGRALSAEERIRQMEEELRRLRGG